MKSLVRLAAAALCALAAHAYAQVPPGYPADYASVVAAARQEGKVRIYSSTDPEAAAPLIKDFERIYPDIKVEYRKMDTIELYKRALGERDAGVSSGDVFWNSAMDLQVKLLNDGFALTYRSPEAGNLPDWAVWRNAGYGTTYEPIVFVYNKRLVKPDEVPQSHADLVKILRANSARFKGKVTTYDITKSGVGFLVFTQDARINPAFWDMIAAAGATSPHVELHSGAMLTRIASGESHLAFNVIGSYARLRAMQEPDIGVVMPKDYTLVMSRIMIIARSAQNPNAAKLWLDYILSRRGQTIIANQSELGSVRDDVEGVLTAHGLARTLGSALKPIRLGPALMTYLDEAKRGEFFKQWRRSAAVGN
jgi:iron(III) transport system substrate-binding protein